MLSSIRHGWRCCDPDVNKLPVAAREMIGKHFSQTKVAYPRLKRTLFQTTSMM